MDTNTCHTRPTLLPTSFGMSTRRHHDEQWKQSSLHERWVGRAGQGIGQLLERNAGGPLLGRRSFPRLTVLTSCSTCQSYWFIASSSVPTSPSAIAFDHTRHRAHSTTSILNPAPVSDHSLEEVCFGFDWLTLKHIPRAEKDDEHDEGSQRSGDRRSANPASGSKPMFQWRHFTARTTYARLRFSLRCFFVSPLLTRCCMHACTLTYLIFGYTLRGGVLLYSSLAINTNSTCPRTYLIQVM